MRDDARLRKAARVVRDRVRIDAPKGGMRFVTQIEVAKTLTDGWWAKIGSLTAAGLQIQVWMDRFSGHSQRNFYAGLYSPEEGGIRTLTKSCEPLWPIKEVSDAEVKTDRFFHLKQKLTSSEFAAPVLEFYPAYKEFYFGIYRNTPAKAGGDDRFCNDAVAFLTDIFGLLPHAQPDKPLAEVYPQCENRKFVKSHLARERSRLLARYCKERDNYKCRICGMTFTEVYGAIGEDFAEAHHIRPLGSLPDEATTSPDDLITVCANCHRMLHRMSGNRDDVKKLRAIWGRHRK